MHGDDDAADRPEKWIFAAADIPQPFAVADAPGRPGGDEHKHRDQRRDIAGVDREHEADRAEELDDDAGMHPGLGRIEPPLAIDFVSERQVAGLRHHMRHQEQPADDAQDVEAVGQVEGLSEMLGDGGHCWSQAGFGGGGAQVRDMEAASRLAIRADRSRGDGGRQMGRGWLGNR